MHTSLALNWSWIQALNALRTDVLDTLGDDDLGFNPGGANISLGKLFVQMGEIESSYRASFETFSQNWDDRNDDPSRETSVEALQTWFEELDNQFQATLEAISDDDVAREIVRAESGAMPVDMQLSVYMQAMFIICGKFVVYLQAMNRSLPPNLQAFIG